MWGILFVIVTVKVISSLLKSNVFALSIYPFLYGCRLQQYKYALFRVHFHPIWQRSMLIYI